jgi:hypothetical protein
MTIDNLEERLAKLDESFKAASSEGGYSNQLPEPGIYQALFREVDFFEAKQTGAAFLKLVFEIVTGEKYKGWPVELIHPLEPDPEIAETKFQYLKRDLKTLGIPVDEDDFSLAQVRPGSEIWTPIFDVPVEIEVKQSKKLNPNTGQPYVNAYLQARLGDPLPKAVQSQLGSDVPAGEKDMAPVPAIPDDDPPPF